MTEYALGTDDNRWYAHAERLIPLLLDEAEAIDLVRARCDCLSSNPDRLAFHKDDIISVIQRPYQLWWTGSLRGHTGLFSVADVESVEKLQKPTHRRKERKSERDIDHAVRGVQQEHHRNDAILPTPVRGRPRLELEESAAENSSPRTTVAWDREDSRGDKHLVKKLSAIREEGSSISAGVSLETEPPLWHRPGWFDKKFDLGGFCPALVVHDANTLRDMMDADENIVLAVAEFTVYARSQPFAEGSSHRVSYASTAISTITM